MTSILFPSSLLEAISASAVIADFEHSDVNTVIQIYLELIRVRNASGRWDSDLVVVQDFSEGRQSSWSDSPIAST